MKPARSTLSAKSTGSTRLAFRVARRMAAQSVGRSVLVAILVAIPVVGMAGMATVAASNVATPAERATLELGRTEARLRVLSAPDPTLKQDAQDEYNWAVDTDADGVPLNQSGTAAPVPPESFLPAGTRLLTIRQTSVVAETAHGLGYFDALQGQPWDKSFSGKWDVTAGTTPTSDYEIMATTATLARFGVALGDSIRVTEPMAGTFRIVGTIRSAALDNSGEELFARPGAFDGVLPEHDLATTEYYLPDTRLDWLDVQQLNTHGATVLSRSVMLDPPPRGELWSSNGFDGSLVLVGLLGGFALFEVALLAGAAFTVGARQQQRALAILASVGGDRRMLFRVMSFGGIILGVLGATLGTLLGVGGAWVYMLVSANGSAARYPGFHVEPLTLVGIIAFATVVGWIAAAVPARAAARVDVVGALRGSRRPPKPTRRRPLFGLILAGLGAAVTFSGGLLVFSATVPTYNSVLATVGVWLIVAGAVIMQIGVVLIAPLILRAAARVFSRFGAGARLGTRDIARNPGRSVPAVAAIMSTVFVAAFAMSLVASAQETTNRTYNYGTAINAARVSLYTYDDTAQRTLSPDGKDVVTALNNSFTAADARLLSSAPDPFLPGMEAARSDTTTTFAFPRVDHRAICPSDALREEKAGSDTPNDARCPTLEILDTNVDRGFDHLWIGSFSDLEAILGEPLSAQSRSTLTAGGAVSLYSQYVVDGKVTLDWKHTTDSGEVPARTVTVPGSVQKPERPNFFSVFMLTSTADTLGVEHQPTLVLAPLPAVPPQAEQDAAMGALLTVSPKLNVSIETGPQAFGATWVWALLALTALIALASATIAIGLARADGQRDDAVLTSLGASPRVRRSFGFWQAIVIAGVGSVIGVLLGLVPPLALSLPQDSSGHSMQAFAPPWLQLALTAIVLPALIAIGSWLTARGTRVRFTSRSAID